MRSRSATSWLTALFLVGCGSSASESPAGVSAPAPATSKPAVANAPAVAAAGSNAAPAPAQVAPPAAASPPSAAAAVPSMAAAPPAAAPPAAATPAQPPPTGAADPTAGTPKLAMDECGLKTKWPGDQNCIKAPPADKGFQMHIGPSNYDNPEPQYVLQPGQEVTEQVAAVSGNDKDVYYYWRQYRMRPGSHHLIINAGTRRLGGSSNQVKDNPEGGVIAPENKGVGMPLAARTQLSNSLHYFNIGDKPIIKEVWVNFWYRDKSEVTQPTNEVFSMLGMGIAPGSHVLKHGACTISQPGRLLTVYGHVHAHDKRFSVWRTRGSDKTLLHEAYDWEHPNVSEFSSTVQNPVLNSAKHMDGGFSGVVDLKAGDVIEFECDIVNDTSQVFLGQNEAENDEMCIMIGDTVGTTVSPLCTGTDVQPSSGD